VAASRRLLTDAAFAEFTIDGVARRAGVARMTVYYQFHSKLGLLEALFDTLASHQGAPRLMEAIGRRDPRAGLREFVALIAGFWETDRVVVSRLQGLAALDADFGRVWSRREALRRQGLVRLAQREAARSRRFSPDRREGRV